MKIKTILCMMALSLCPFAAFAYSFTITSSDDKGREYYITYTETSDTTVEVSKCTAVADGVKVNILAEVTDYSTIYRLKYKVASIGVGAFKDFSSLAEVSTGNRVTTIGDDAFSGCSSLTKVTLGEKVTTIGNYAFQDCISLGSIKFPKSVMTIEYDAFKGCSKLSKFEVDGENPAYTASSDILYSKDKTVLHAYPAKKGGSSFTVPNTVTSIEGYAFNSCSNLTSVTIPGSVTTIEEAVFSNCSNLTSVTIPSSVTAIREAAFWGCSSLASITIPNTVTTIGGFAFSWCSSLTSVTIPNSVTTIGENAFFRCTGLTSVTIPGSVTTMGGNHTFAYCSSLTDVHVNWATPIDVPGDIFDGVNVASCTLHVPAGTEALYKAADVWKNFHIVAQGTGNESLETSPGIWYSGGVLSVRTPASETVTVYSLNGVAVFRAAKEAGPATFRLNDLPRGVYIVRGGSGWTGKILK
jgi:hypothetical protein